MPCSVQAATSRWFVLRPVWLMNPEPGQALDYLTGQGHTLLRQHQRVAIRGLGDHARRVGVGIGMDDDLVILQPGVGTGPAKDIGVVVNHCDFHSACLHVS